MARAEAECTCSVCGNKFYMYATKRNTKDAESWVKWAQKTYVICDDCVQRETDCRNEENMKASREAGYPELKGTEKQIAWASTIRYEAIDILRNSLQRFADENEADKEYEDYQKNLETIAIANNLFHWLVNGEDHENATWWIDKREFFPSRNNLEADQKRAFRRFIDGKLMNNFRKYLEAHPLEEPSEEEVQAVAEIVEPENKTHAGVVTITATEKVVAAKYEKDEDFRRIVKELGYSWNSEKMAWMKEIKYITGKYQDRAAELGNTLLRKGFAVQIEDKDIRNSAISGEFEPEHKRWILLYVAGDYAGWLCVTLKYGDGMYSKAMNLPGSKYYKPNIAVPVSEYREVEDFAQVYDYRIAPAAAKAIEEYKASSMVVKPGKPTEAAEKDVLKDILSSSRDVLEDLKEED